MTWNNPPPIVPTKAKAGKIESPEELKKRLGIAG